MYVPNTGPPAVLHPVTAHLGVNLGAPLSSRSFASDQLKRVLSFPTLYFQLLLFFLFHIFPRISHHQTLYHCHLSLSVTERVTEPRGPILTPWRPHRRSQISTAHRRRPLSTQPPTRPSLPIPPTSQVPTTKMTKSPGTTSAKRFPMF